MFITKASRHDKADIKEFLEAEGPWDGADIDRGTAFVVREGAIIGHARLTEIAPQTSIVEKVLVKSDRRRQGIGTRVMEAAMNNKGGKLYLSCEEEHAPFFEKLGFSTTIFETLPDEVQQFLRREGEDPSDESHPHIVMTAR